MTYHQRCYFQLSILCELPNSVTKPTERLNHLLVIM